MSAAQRSFSSDEVRGNFVPREVYFSADFANLRRVQNGLKSRGFSGARAHPVQERAITNFHRRLREFLRDAPSRNT